MRTPNLVGVYTGWKENMADKYSKKTKVNQGKALTSTLERNCCHWKAMGPEDMGHGGYGKKSQKKKISVVNGSCF